MPAAAQWRGHSCPRALSLRLLCLSLLSPLFLALSASAGTLSGTVKNGTTGKPVAHQTVVLLSPMGGMQEITAVDTDAQGRFQFNAPEIGQGPLLVRVPYQNVRYHQSVTPGRDSVDITVFDSTAPASAMKIASRTIIFQPNGSRLLVGEEFQIQNETNPPATYANAKGTFEFGIPDGAQIGQVSTTAPGSLPVTQGTIDRAKNRFALDFAIKPGESNIRVTYELPYDGDRASVRPVTLAPTPRAMIAAPVGVQISGDGFAPAGTDQGFTLLTRENLASGAAFSVSLSGAAQVQAQSQQPERSQPAGRDSGSSGAPAADSISEISPRLSSFQWIILGGMGLFFLAGFFFLMRQQSSVPATAGGAIPLAVPSPEKKSARRESGSPRAAASQPAPSDVDPGINPRSPSYNAAATVLQEAERGARMNLEELKDTLFRLELRRQAGTITDDDYARERTRIEASLRDLVRG